MLRPLFGRACCGRGASRSLRLSCCHLLAIGGWRPWRLSRGSRRSWLSRRSGALESGPPQQLGEPLQHIQHGAVGSSLLALYLCSRRGKAEEGAA